MGRFCSHRGGLWEELQNVSPIVPDFRNENQVCGRKVFRASIINQAQGKKGNTPIGEAVPKTCAEHSGMAFKVTLTLSIQPLNKH